MARIALTNKSGKWFDRDKAQMFEEKRIYLQSATISKATNERFYHEALYITKTGVFILNKWSDYQNSIETYEEISKERAARWFTAQSFQDEEIPDVLKNEVRNYEI